MQCKEAHYWKEPTRNGARLSSTTEVHCRNSRGRAAECTSGIAMTCREVSAKPLEDNRETYVFAYVPTNPERDGKFRRITVAIHAEKCQKRRLDHSGDVGILGRQRG